MFDLRPLSCLIVGPNPNSTGLHVDFFAYEGAWCQIRGAILDFDNIITPKDNKLVF
jgi:hypothetical protein